MYKRFIIFLAIVSLILPIPGQAAFNYNEIITDAEAQDYNTMSQVEIKNFLESHNSFLTNYWYEGNNPAPSELAIDPDEKYFKKRSATEVIWNASQEAKINPQFLLTNLQKEMGLVEDPNPKERAVSYAMGYGCPDSGGCDFRFKGFGKQVRGSALQFRHFIDNIDEYNHSPGQRSCVDDPTPFLPCTVNGNEIKPTNAITAAMYIYTPHIHGNKLFRSIWDRYGFGGSTEQIIIPEGGIIPEGALVKARDGEDTESIYLISGGLKRPFATMTALVSRYDPAKIISISSEELDKYNVGKLIKYTNYSLLESPSGEVYLLDGLSKRLIASDEVFKNLGFNQDEITQASYEDLALIDNGAVIDKVTVNPFGELMQDSITSSIYYVKDGSRWQVIDPSIVEANFDNLNIKEVTTKTLENYQYQGALKLADGTLIKEASNPDVYVISAGQRRLIPDGATFEAFGYDWTNILTIPEKIINFHSLGQPLSL